MSSTEEPNLILLATNTGLQVVGVLAKIVGVYYVTDRGNQRPLIINRVFKLKNGVDLIRSFEISFKGMAQAII